MKKVIVIGGSGFIGRAVQRHVLDQRMENAFIFSYNKHPEKISNNLEKVRMDLLNKDNIKAIESYPIAIYLAGNADHGLARRFPSLDLNLNVKAFLDFMEGFRGSLVLLSSQAVYYGLEGEIHESEDRVSTIPYGLSKQMIEAYAKYFLRTDALSKLWIFRLTYAFGECEKERRLIPRCARATYSNERVIVFGGGKSFLNPLPSWFVAKLLIKAVESLEERSKGFLEITNMNYPEKITVRDVVRFLESIKHFDYIFSEGGEEWPVRFWGNTKNLSAYLKVWKIDFPNLWDGLKKYFTELVSGRKNG